MKKIYFVIAAVAMMMAGCEKQADNDKVVNGINSFELNIQGFGNPSGAKTRWDDAGLWWEEGDELVINDVIYSVGRRDDGTWIATTESTTGAEAVGSLYYVAYPSTGVVTGSVSTAHTYGPIDFDGTTIPMAAVTSTNSITLYPCCAVLKMATGVYGESISFTDVDGKICSSGTIDIESKTIISGTSIEDNALSPVTVGDYDYYIVPMEGESVTCTIVTDWGLSAENKELRKGVIYKID